LRANGIPFRRSLQRSVLDLADELANPRQFRLPEDHAVLDLDEKEPEHALLYAGVQRAPRLVDLLLEEVLAFLEERDRLARRKVGDERPPGRELRILLHRLAQQLAKPAEELGAARLRQRVEGPLRTPAVAQRLLRYDQLLPLERLDHRVERAVVELDALL